MNKIIKFLPLVASLLLVTGCGDVANENQNNTDDSAQKSTSEGTPGSTSEATPSSSGSESTPSSSSEVTPSSSSVETPTASSEVTPSEEPTQSVLPSFTPSSSEEEVTTYSLLSGYNFSGGSHFQNNEEVQRLKTFINGNCDNHLVDILCTECHCQPADGIIGSETEPPYLTLGTGKKTGKITLTFDVNISELTVSVLSYHKYDPAFNTPDETKVQVNLESSDKTVDAITTREEVNTTTPFDITLTGAETVNYNKVVIQSISNPKYRVMIADILITVK